MQSRALRNRTFIQHPPSVRLGGFIAGGCTRTHLLGERTGMRQSCRIKVFLDFEASSLSDRSHLIEVAWVFQDGRSEDHLIAPALAWNDWDDIAETVHGMPVVMLPERTSVYAVSALQSGPVAFHQEPAAEVPLLPDERMAGSARLVSESSRAAIHHSCRTPLRERTPAFGISIGAAGCLRMAQTCRRWPRRSGFWLAPSC